MKKMKKIYKVFVRKFIKSLEYLNLNLYMKLYVNYLIKEGVLIDPSAKYISNTVYFDGTDYSKIKIGKNVTISKEVMFLTHDYSVTTSLATLDIYVERNKAEYYILDNINIGDNCFIGARSSILPGTTIGNNVIVGACTVVKGEIPDDVIVVGNPYKIVANTKEYAKRMMKNEKLYQN